MSSSSTYQYAPLSDELDSMRVMELLPGSFDEPIIRITITNTRFTEVEKKYEAISWTWGDGTSPKSVIIADDDTELQVSSNCYNVLRYLRDPVETRTLWLDAICIDQSNDEERYWQIMIMDSIYMLAKQTVAFLGERSFDDSMDPGWTDTQRLFFAAAVAGLCHSKEPHDRIIALTPLLRFLAPKKTISKRKTLDGETSESDGSEARSQDIRDELVNYELPPETLFYRFAELILQDGGLGLLLMIRHPHSKEMPSWVPDWTMCTAKSMRIEEIPALFWVLNWETSSDAANGKPCNIDGYLDKVGEAVDKMLKEEKKAQHIDGATDTNEMDYTEHPDDMRNPNPFFVDSSTHPSLGLFPRASWLKNWTCNPQDFRDFEILGNPAVESPGPRFLHVKGIRYGTITDIGPAMSIEPSTIEEKRKSVRHLIDTIDQMRLGGKPTGWPDQITSAFARLRNDEELIGDLLRSMGDWRFRDCMENEETLFEIATACHEGRFFVTDNNRDIGLSSQNVRQGDLVCLVKGAIDPCILRANPRNGGWRIISGECIMQSLAHGLRVRKTPGRKGLLYIWQYINEYIAECEMNQEKFLIS
ncbi:heterokaryon incompatibility protein-domain-containing protein [Astrocystis sublimbata]|nr:heterokaryon incompatibility protein-domain-containing protein [Astrocystis sublimbata]